MDGAEIMSKHIGFSKKGLKTELIECHVTCSIPKLFDYQHFKINAFAPVYNSKRTCTSVRYSLGLLYVFIVNIKAVLEMLSSAPTSGFNMDGLKSE